MRSWHGGIVVSLLLSLPSWSQQAAPASGPVLLEQALGAMAASIAVSDATLTGTARRIAGSDDETGNVTLQALATGQSQIKYAYPSGPRSELISISSAGVPVGSWTGPDNVGHPMSYHNLLTDSSWFFPALTLSKLLVSRTTAITVVGQDMREGISVTHLTATQQFTDVPADKAPSMQHVSQMDLFLDTSTLFPAALDFNVHPDNNMLLDIPVEIRFSDYRAVSGVQVPFRVQRYMNNSLILDVQLQTATLNSGLTASAFTIQ